MQTCYSSYFQEVWRYIHSYMNHTRLLLGEMLTEKALIIYMSQKMNGVFLKVVNIQKYYHSKSRIPFFSHTVLNMGMALATTEASLKRTKKNCSFQKWYFDTNSEMIAMFVRGLTWTMSEVDHRGSTKASR